MKKSEFEFFEMIHSHNIKNQINSLCSSKSNFNKQFLELIAKKYNLKTTDIKNKQNLCAYLQNEIGTISFFSLFGLFFKNTISDMVYTMTSSLYLNNILLKTQKLSKKLLFQYILIEGKNSNLKNLMKILATEPDEFNIPLFILGNDLTYYVNFFSKQILELNNIMYGISFSFTRLFTNTNPGYLFSTNLNKKDFEIANLLKKWFERMYDWSSKLRDELLNDPKYLKSVEIQEMMRTNTLRRESNEMRRERQQRKKSKTEKMNMKSFMDLAKTRHNLFGIRRRIQNSRPIVPLP